MNEKAATILCALVLGASHITWATGLAYGRSLATGPEKMSARKTQNDITITCPGRITYQVQPIAEWNAGMYGIKQLKFEDAAVTGRILNCNYSANNGDSSTLSREMPAGNICKNDFHAGSKNWQFLCKRAVAPIKIKPKSD